VAHPTDSKPLHRGIEILARLARPARRHGVKLRQSYMRVAKQARREAAKLIHSGRPRQAERQVRRLRIRLGRPFRDIGRKIAGDAAAEAAFAGPLGLVARRGCRASAARTAAGPSSTRCTPPRRSASAGARRTRASSSA
jgi:IS5 family transposase